MQNALDALDGGVEPKIGVDYSGNCCGLYNGGRVNMMFVTAPKYGLPKGPAEGHNALDFFTWCIH